jgi:hypothetical protein
MYNSRTLPVKLNEQFSSSSSVMGEVSQILKEVESSHEAENPLSGLTKFDVFHYSISIKDADAPPMMTSIIQDTC